MVENQSQTVQTEAAQSAAKKPPVVKLTNVGKWYRASRQSQPTVVMKGIDLEVPDTAGGELIVLLGPSGCGKSTILHMVSGMLEPDEGEVLVFGKPVNGPEKHTVTVPQAYTCYPWLSALGNVRFGLAVIGASRSEQTRVATEYLQKVGLGNRLDAFPRQLSGGMQQRVAIARTLAMKPPLVLMDEPFGALDAQTRSEMQQMLLQLWTEEQNTILFVTHDITEALLLADRIIVFSMSPAQVVLDQRVPFPRPRPASLVMEPEFVRWSQALLQTLKGAEAHA